MIFFQDKNVYLRTDVHGIISHFSIFRYTHSNISTSLSKPFPNHLEYYEVDLFYLEILQIVLNDKHFWIIQNCMYYFMDITVRSPFFSSSKKKRQITKKERTVSRWNNINIQFSITAFGVGKLGNKTATFKT